MKQVNIKDFKNGTVHFIGIGGISMSGLAEYLLQKGYTVIGSDVLDSYIIKDLRDKGVKIDIGHKSANVIGADLIIYTSAIVTSGENPEMMEAKKRNLPLMNRATLMGQIMKEYPDAIGIA